MATKYSDFIHLQDFLPVYDILEEGPSSWQSFIPTAQFNEMLQRSLTAITSSEISKRRSIWVRGTFGTGKSHASAVVKHLLCDDYDSIKTYIENINDPALKSQVRNLRQNKRYFAVTLKGVQQAYDIPRFTLSLQREVSKAVKAVEPDFVVNSDFTAAINWIEGHRRIFEEEVIPNAKDLVDNINTADEAITFLRNYNPGMYITIENSIRETIGSVFEQTAIAEWLSEVEQEIEKRGIANGLIIFWDEFTSVMDTLKSDRINLLQNIAEKSQHHNVFLFLISHRVESQSTDNKAKDITKMSDRFDEDEKNREIKSTLLNNFSREFENLVIVLAEETFSTQAYNKFIDAVATSKVARSHFNESEAKEFEKAAHAFVSKWITQLRHNTYNVYFNGESYREGTIDQLPDLLNNKLCAKIYNMGFETMRFPKGVVPPMTFYKDGNCPKVIQQILQAQNRDQLTSHGSNASPLKYLFEENGNTLIKADGMLSENALNGHSWLVEICHHVEKCMEKARKEYADKFSLPVVLASFIKPPYGMFTSMLNCAAIAYALRKYKSELFQTTISQPISDEALCTMVTDLFKMWKDGKSDSNPKMFLRFGSKEESDLTKLLYDTFDLGHTIKAKLDDVKSLDNAKWYIQEFCKLYAKQPLWTLIHIPGLSEDLRNAIQSLIAIFAQEATPVEKIKAIYRDIKNNHVELLILITNVDNYEKGFINFVDSIEGVKIEKAWWNEMLEKLSQLPSEIAFRKESDVEKAIYQFYIRKTSGNGGQKGDDGSGNGENSNNSGNDGDSSNENKTSKTDIVKQAKEKIKTTNMPNTMWQMAILNLLEQYPETADFFNRL